MTTKTTIQLSANFTDTTLPKDRVDPVLPDQGALLLVDMTHPALPATIVGVPMVQGNVAPVHNLAWQQAAAMIGSGDATTLAVPMSSAGIGVSGLSAIERTGKGGVHLYHSRASDPGSMWWGPRPDQVGTTQGKVDATAPMAKWIFDHSDAVSGGGTGHKFYVSVWNRVTRPREGTLNPNPNYTAEIANPSQASTNRLLTLGSTAPGGQANIPVRGRNPSLQLVGPTFTNGDSDTFWTGTKPTNSIVFRSQIGAGGDMFGFTGPYRQGHACLVFYRFYVEDLTVSGRTYAQVDALDFAQYTKDCLTAGGRYYNDTFTDPAAIP